MKTLYNYSRFSLGHDLMEDAKNMIISFDDLRKLQMEELEPFFQSWNEDYCRFLDNLQEFRELTEVEQMPPNRRAAYYLQYCYIMGYLTDKEYKKALHRIEESQVQHDSLSYHEYLEYKQLMIPVPVQHTDEYEEVTCPNCGHVWSEQEDSGYWADHCVQCGQALIWDFSVDQTEE